MSNPDYSKYTLEELYQAQSTIDHETYPDRVKEIQEAILKLKANTQSEDVVNSKSAEVLAERRILLHKAAHQMRRIAGILFTISLIFGMAAFLRYTFQIAWGGVNYSFRFQFPGSSDLGKNNLLMLATMVVHIINVTFVVSSIGSFFKIRIFTHILALSWGLMSIGVHLWKFMWWPTVSFDFPLGFDVSILGLAVGFKVNLLSSLLFTWTLALIPEMIQELAEQDM